MNEAQTQKDASHTTPFKRLKTQTRLSDWSSIYQRTLVVLGRFVTIERRLCCTWHYGSEILGK